MHHFITREDGAVTVDWVVLTAAIVGLGLATMTVVRGGVADASTDIHDTLDGIDMVDAIVQSADFENGDRGNCIGGAVREIADFGSVLALSGSSNSASLAIDIGDEHSYADIEFDMIMGDSWDGETGSISLNGQEIVIGTHNWQVNDPDVRGVDGPGDTTIELLRASKDTGATSWGSGNDYTYRVKVTHPNDGSTMDLTASTTLQQGAHDEFLGIDNVQVTGSDQG